MHFLNPLLVLTNLFVLPSIIKLIEIGDFVDSFLFLILMITSMFYHGCKDMGVCFLDLKILSFLDVMLASSLVICLSLQYAASISSLAFNILPIYKTKHHHNNRPEERNKKSRITHHDTNRQLKTIITLLLLIINGIWIAVNDFTASLYQKIFTLIYCFSVIIRSLIYHLDSNEMIWLNGKLLLTGVLITTVGYILFEIASIDMWVSYYFLSHSLWHVLSSIGLYFLISATIK